MTIEEMKKRKIELGYTNETIANLSDVPLGTVQKIFAGVTKAPRYDTIQKIQAVLYPISEYVIKEEPQYEVAEAVGSFNAMSGTGSEDNSKITSSNKVKVGMFDNKYKMPPDKLFYNDDIYELFEGKSWTKQMTLDKCGNGVGMPLSEDVLKLVGASANDTFDVEVINNKIIITPIFRHRSLKERAEEYDGKLMLSQEMDREEPVGSEVW